MDPDIRTILEAAIQAPSGENVQPWRFRVNGKTIELHHASVDSEIYDWESRVSLIAHGAALENMVLSASALGYETNVILFPDSARPTYIASLALGEKKQPVENVLVEAIPKRVTNRNSYEVKPLEETASNKLQEISDGSKTIRYLRVTEREKIQKLARVGSTNEEVMLQNRVLHDFFFDHVTWTKEEDEQKRVGFYIKALGLPPPVQVMFKLFKNWSVMNVLKKAGFPAQVGKQNAATYNSTSEMGILSIRENAPKNYVEAGRLLQRIWLQTTVNNVAMQPIAGTLYMGFYLAAHPGSTEVFSIHERSLVENAVKMAREVVGDGSIPVFMFRLGYGKPPEARSTRFPLEYFLL